MNTEELDDSEASSHRGPDDTYLKKLDYLDDNFDEDALHNTYFPNNLRCVSFSQSYNLLDAPQNQNADEALRRAKSII